MSRHLAVAILILGCMSMDTSSYIPQYALSDGVRLQRHPTNPAIPRDAKFYRYKVAGREVEVMSTSTLGELSTSSSNIAFPTNLNTRLREMLAKSISLPNVVEVIGAFDTTGEHYLPEHFPDFKAHSRWVSQIESEYCESTLMELTPSYSTALFQPAFRRIVGNSTPRASLKQVIDWYIQATMGLIQLHENGQIASACVEMDCDMRTMIYICDGVAKIAYPTRDPIGETTGAEGDGLLGVDDGEFYDTAHLTSALIHTLNRKFFFEHIPNVQGLDFIRQFSRKLFSDNTFAHLYGVKLKYSKTNYSSDIVVSPETRLEIIDELFKVLKVSFGILHDDFQPSAESSTILLEKLTDFRSFLDHVQELPPSEAKDAMVGDVAGLLTGKMDRS